MKKSEIFELIAGMAMIVLYFGMLFIIIFVCGTTET